MSEAPVSLEFEATGWDGEMKAELWNKPLCLGKEIKPPMQAI